MARIEGVDLPKYKRIEIGLTYIYGIGLSKSNEILQKTDINKDKKIKELSDEQIILLRNILSNDYELEGNLKRSTAINIKRLIEINCYRGKRHKTNLPMRGQRTRTNARTGRGSKKTIAGKKKAQKK